MMNCGSREEVARRGTNRGGWMMDECVGCLFEFLDE